MSIFEELTDALSVKRDFVDVALPLDSETRIVFTFSTIGDFPSYRKALYAAAEFGKEAEAQKPNLVAVYGDDLLPDAAAAAACHFMAHSMVGVRKEKLSEEAEPEVIEREDKPWSTKTLMRFAKRCGPAFMAFAQRVDNALNVTALEGEADAIEEAKKKSERTPSLETPSLSQETADSPTLPNGEKPSGETHAITSR